MPTTYSPLASVANVYTLAVSSSPARIAKPNEPVLKPLGGLLLSPTTAASVAPKPVSPGGATTQPVEQVNLAPTMPVAPVQLIPPEQVQPRQLGEGITY